MSRTNARFEQKSPFTDGIIFVGANAFVAASGTAALARNAKGDFSFNVGASQACVFIAPLDEVLYRTGMAPFLQEKFGTAANVPGPSAVANTSDPDATPSPYFPPFTGITELTPSAGFVAKGMQINDVTLHYLITTNALSLHTAGVSKTVFPVSGTPGALVVTDILANAANGLATAANASPQTTKIAIATPAFTITDLSEIVLEVDATTPAGGAYRLYGASLHVSFNFN